MEIIINVATDFSKTPGGRHITEGPFSGEDFRDKILSPKYQQAKKENKQLRVILDGGYGYAPSFLEEAFGGLARITKDKKMLDIIIIVSDEEHELINDIDKYIRESLEESDWKNL